MYIPIRMPAGSLPPYLQINQDSPWHTGALLSMALESMTLPSRMRRIENQGATLADLEAILNSNGNQKIAQLQYSIKNPSELSSDHSKSADKNDDPRISRMNTREPLLNQDESSDLTTRNDMDFFGSEPHPSTSYRESKTARVFGRVESLRGALQQKDVTRETEDEWSRKRRRLTSMPAVHRLVGIFSFGYLCHLYPPCVPLMQEAPITW